MKTSLRSLHVLTILILFCFSHRLFAQSDNQPLSLVKQGELLHSQGKYDESIAKFTEALKADPEDAAANYGIAFTLYSAKRPLEGIPYLEKVVKSPHPGLVVGAYSLMGSIYDENHQSPKAIEMFNQVIKLAPNYPQAYYNLGLAYSRNQQYAEAETAAIEAIKREPKSAGIQRLYALAAFHQNKRMNALMAFCSFLLIEPSGPRAAEALNNIQSILKGGVLKDAGGNIPKTDPETNALNTDIQKITAAAPAKKLQGTDLLEYELKTIITTEGQSAEKKTSKSFFDNFFAQYLYKLSQSDNMPAFLHIVSIAANKDEYTRWAGENQQKVDGLKDWVKNTERNF